MRHTTRLQLVHVPQKSACSSDCYVITVADAKPFYGGNAEMPSQLTRCERGIELPCFPFGNECTFIPALLNEAARRIGSSRNEYLSWSEAGEHCICVARITHNQPELSSRQICGRYSDLIG